MHDKILSQAVINILVLLGCNKITYHENNKTTPIT